MACLSFLLISPDRTPRYVFPPPLLRGLIEHEIHSCGWGLLRDVTGDCKVVFSRCAAYCQLIDLFLPCSAFLSIPLGERLEIVWSKILSSYKAALERHTLGPGRQEVGSSHSPSLGSGNKRGFQEREASGKISGFDYQECELFLFLLSAEGNDSNDKGICLLWVSSHISTRANISTLGKTTPPYFPPTFQHVSNALCGILFRL